MDGLGGVKYERGPRTKDNLKKACALRFEPLDSVASWVERYQPYFTEPGWVTPRTNSHRKAIIGWYMGRVHAEGIWERSGRICSLRCG
jgi:hypothetical protein